MVGLRTLGVKTVSGPDKGTSWVRQRPWCSSMLGGLDGQNRLSGKSSEGGVTGERVWEVIRWLDQIRPQQPPLVTCTLSELGDHKRILHRWGSCSDSHFIMNSGCFGKNHWKRPWCWERLKVGGEGDNWGWDGWMALPTQWTWVWVNSGSWWSTGKPGVLQSMGLKRVGHNWLNWTKLKVLINKEEASVGKWGN